MRDENGDPILDEFGDQIPREAAVISIVRKTDEGEEIILGDANSEITGGSLGGLLHSTDVEADGMNPGLAQKALNNVAKGLAQLFNTLNTKDGAYCINPNNTGKLMATEPDNFIFGEAIETTDAAGNKIYIVDVDASNISVNSNLLTEDGCWKIACAFFGNDDNVDLDAVGNAQNAAAMLGTRNQKMAELGNMSLEDYYTGLVGKVAAGGSNIQALVDTQSEVVDSIYDKILSNNSVDLNEELVDLVKYQTAYSAAAQVFNTCNSCLNTLMTLGG